MLQMNLVNCNISIAVPVTPVYILVVCHQQYLYYYIFFFPVFSTSRDTITQWSKYSYILSFCLLWLKSCLFRCFCQDGELYYIHALNCWRSFSSCWPLTRSISFPNGTGTYIKIASSQSVGRSSFKCCCWSYRFICIYYFRTSVGLI